VATVYDLHRLRLLRELKHRGTLAAVAEAMSYSPSSVSQQLSQLQAEVGIPLLEPVGRRVRLTPQAEILVAHTEAVLERLEQARADVATSLREVTGTVRVAAFQTAALALVPHALTLLARDHPGLRVHVTEAWPDVALPALLSRDFDLVLGEEYPGDPVPFPPELEREDLCADPLRLAVPDVFGGASLLSVAERPWVMEIPGSPARRWASALCRRAGFEPDVRFETSDLLLHVRLVEAGLAVALLPDLVWYGRTPSMPLHPLPRGRRTRTVFSAVRRGHGAHPAITACRAALQAASPT
jgi:DNA-binding transcriptional LysR family regulator